MPAYPDVAQESWHTCVVCLNEVQEDQGEYTCLEHWYCHPCMKEAFERAMQHMDEFPARCCQNTDMQYQLDDTPVLIALSLNSEFVQQYKLKLKEHEVPASDRVYCANTACAKFQDPDDFTATHTVWCACGTLTCTDCKGVHAADHICTTPTRPGLPPYSNDLRVKECPNCHQPIELRDACNHMVCSVCRHEFCFICLLPWCGTHDVCPYYGEVTAGHDDDGFERTERGIHIRTGLNRHGMNRLGKRFTDPDRNDTSVDIASNEPVLAALEDIAGTLVEEFLVFHETANMIANLRVGFAMGRQLLAEEGAVPVQPPAPVMPAMPQPVPQELLQMLHPGMPPLQDLLQMLHPGMPPLQAMPQLPGVADLPLPDPLQMLQHPGMPPLPVMMGMPQLLATLEMFPVQEAQAMLQNAGDKMERHQNRLNRLQQLVQELGTIQALVQIHVRAATRERTATQRAWTRMLLDGQAELADSIQQRFSRIVIETIAEFAEAVTNAIGAARGDGAW